MINTVAQTRALFPKEQSLNFFPVQVEIQFGTSLNSEIKGKRVRMDFHAKGPISLGNFTGIVGFPDGAGYRVTQQVKQHHSVPEFPEAIAQFEYFARSRIIISCRGLLTNKSSALCTRLNSLKLNLKCIVDIHRKRYTVRHNQCLVSQMQSTVDLVGPVSS